MHSSESQDAPTQFERKNSEDIDRFPTTIQALRRVLDDERLPEGPIEWFEIHALANGELSYRVRRPRSDDVDGGFIPSAASL